MTKFIKVTTELGIERFINIASIVQFFESDNGLTCIELPSRCIYVTESYPSIALELTGGR